VVLYALLSALCSLLPVVCCLLHLPIANSSLFSPLSSLLQVSTPVRDSQQTLVLSLRAALLKPTKIHVHCGRVSAAQDNDIVPVVVAVNPRALHSRFILQYLCPLLQCYMYP
jgi:hypothetical protein